MKNWLEKSQTDNRSQSPARRSMEQALARLSRVDVPATREAARPTARLAFALDLTGSRAPSLRNARVATAAMFDTVRGFGSIALKLIYYRGQECKATGWEDDPDIVNRAMQQLCCECGGTQIARALQHVLNEAEVSGVAFIGDHCEEDPAELLGIAEALGRKGVPVFVFHECSDGDTKALEAKPVFKRMAEISRGVYSEFKPESAVVMRELLSSVAAFSMAGIEGVNRAPLPQTIEARRLHRQLLLGAGTSPARRG